MKSSTGFLLLLFSTFLNAASLRADDRKFFYKDKFPGLTCVPLSFYISTQLGSDDFKAFWKPIDGPNSEAKFGSFLDQCNFYRFKKETGYEGDTAKFLYSSLSQSHDVSFFGSIPKSFTIEGGGMWLRDLYSVVTHEDEDLTRRLKLAYYDYRRERTPHPAEDLSPDIDLWELRKKFIASLKAGVPPIIGVQRKVWQTPNFLEGPVWMRTYSHAVTVVGVDENGGDFGQDYFNVEYIDNEDGLSKKAIFYSRDNSPQRRFPAENALSPETIYFRNPEVSTNDEFFELIEMILANR